MLCILSTAHRTNGSILDNLRIIDRLSTVCRRPILAYFWHITRRKCDNLERLFVQYKVEREIRLKRSWNGLFIESCEKLKPDGDGGNLLINHKYNHEDTIKKIVWDLSNYYSNIESQKNCMQKLSMKQSLANILAFINSINRKIKWVRLICFVWCLSKLLNDSYFLYIESYICMYTSRYTTNVKIIIMAKWRKLNIFENYLTISLYHNVYLLLITAKYTFGTISRYEFTKFLGI